MEENMAGTSATKMKTENMSLTKPQGDVSFPQKKNNKLMGEVRKWKERALKAEEKLKQDKRAHDGHITKLGFKMLQFENELRKEQREIEQRFLEKDQQIRVLEDVVSSLHDKMKTNTLCYNCFMTKHNTPLSELSPGPESFVAKFPLDLDFNDRKSPTHDGKPRSMSLPLSLHGTHDSPKSSADFCFHHMLSPVPEELENSFLEHAKKVNHQSIIEEEEEENMDQEAEGSREEGAINCGQATDNEKEVPVFNPNQDGIHEEETPSIDQLFLAETTINSSKKENLSDCDEDKSGINIAQCTLASRKADETSEKAVLDESEPNEEMTSLDDKNIDTSASVQEQEIRLYESEGSVKDESVNICLEENKTEVQSETKTTTVGPDEIVCADVQLIIDEVVDKIIGGNIFKENTEIDSSTEVEKGVIPTFSYDASNIEIISEQENSNKKPLSPKSEMIVAELKKAIFEASLKGEEEPDQDKHIKESNMHIEDKTTKVVSEISDGETKSLDDQEKVSDSGENTSAIIIEDIALNFTADGQKTKGEDSDSLTDYDVIELD